MTNRWVEYLSIPGAKVVIVVPNSQKMTALCKAIGLSPTSGRDRLVNGSTIRVIAVDPNFAGDMHKLAGIEATNMIYEVYVYSYQQLEYFASRVRAVSSFTGSLTSEALDFNEMLSMGKSYGSNTRR